ncbi:MAG: indole-3-glycerol-phosphate synthase [Chromatiaceae bacterium]
MTQLEPSRRPAKLSLSESIRKRQREGQFPVVSEIKVRSEKEGELLRDRDPVALALEMTQNPVAGISVVTEETHFGGSMDLLRSVAAAVSVPVLHKDFVATEDQLRQSAASGASAVLLIASMLEPANLARLIEAARGLGLETLVEAHTLEEVNAIAHLPFDLAGINNRDIKILEVDDEDVGRTERLARHFPRGRILISESAISGAEDVKRARQSGADAVLVGTAVLKAEPVGKLLRELIGVGWPE